MATLSEPAPEPDVGGRRLADAVHAAGPDTGAAGSDVAGSNRVGDVVLRTSSKTSRCLFPCGPAKKKIQGDGKLYMPTPQISLIQRRIETLKAELIAEKARLRRALIRHLFQIFYLETQVDINAQFPAHVYENADDEAETDGEADPTCSVCMQSFEGTYVRTLACGHVFHDTCIDEWVKRTENCPLCRREIVFEEHAPSHLLIDTLQALADVL